MPTIYLIRHAEPVSPALYSGSDLDRPLSERGRKQAQWMARHLNACGATKVFTSPYARCQQTAEIIAKAIGLKPELRQELHIAHSFRAEGANDPQIYVAHSNNIPVALDALGIDCHACGHASCWTVMLDGQGKVVSAEYLRPDV